MYSSSKNSSESFSKRFVSVKNVSLISVTSLFDIIIEDKTNPESLSIV